MNGYMHNFTFNGLLLFTEQARASLT